MLPLANFSGDPRDEYFADGLTEELISTLATIGDLSVIARTSVAKFKGARLDIREIGAALNVGSILEGSTRIAGDEARINVHLVDVRSQKTIWSQEFKKTLKDVLAVQSAIAMSVSDSLKIRLLAGEKNLLERSGPSNGEAYREYLLGRSQLSQRTGGRIAEAIGSFSHALERDPDFALACAGLAEAYTLAGVAGYGMLPRAQTIENARTFAKKAVVLDDSLAEAHAALAYVRFRIDWDWPGAEAAFKRAIALKPGLAHSHELYGLYLAIQKRPDEAMAEMHRAQQLDPLSPSVSNGIGRLLHFQRKYAEAVAQFKATLVLDPRYGEAYFSMGISWALLGRYDDAIAAINKAIELSDRRPVMLAMLGLVNGMAGRRAETRRIHDQMLEESRTTPVSPYYFGTLALGLGDIDQAMQKFEESYEKRDGILIYLPLDPVGESIWADPRFIALVQKMGLKPPSVGSRNTPRRG